MAARWNVRGDADPPTVPRRRPCRIPKVLAQRVLRYLDGVVAVQALVDLLDADLRRMSGLVRRYADRRPRGTDASIVAVCERLDVDTVATLNPRDFDNVRPRHRPSFTVVPGPDF